VVAPGGSLDTAQAQVSGVLANDSDPDGDQLTAQLHTDPSHGSLVLRADGSFVYTPNPLFDGTDSFTYLVNDGFFDSDVATVTLHVNASPLAFPHFYLVPPGQTLDIPPDGATVSGVLANAFDTEGDPLTASLAPNGGPANGTLSLNSDGSFTYTPNAGFHGADSFTYVANDGFSNSAPATVTLAVDTPPVAVNDTYVILVPGQEIDIGLDAAGNGTPGVLANDTDADGDTLSAHPLLDPFDSPKHGHVTLSADGSFVYTPNPGYTGPDSFSYFASDGLVSSNIATVSLRVAPVARSDFTWWLRVRA
jgi:VCBS repeat-containing protein